MSCEFDEVAALLGTLIKHSPDPEAKLPKPPRVKRVRLKFVIPHGDAIRGFGSARSSRGMENFQGAPWTLNIRDRSPHFVVVTELDES